MVAVFFMFGASSAFALMEDPNFNVGATSTYNPALGDDVYWRWQWGNSPEPDVTFTAFPSDTVEDLRGMGYESAAEGRTQTDGFWYEMRQMDTLGTFGVVPIPQPGTSDLTGRNVEGEFKGELKTLLVGGFDITGLSNEYGWVTDATHPNANVSGDGLWVARYRFKNQYRTESASMGRMLYVGLDRTNPDTVRGLAPRYLQPQSLKGWTEARRVNLIWARPVGVSDNYDRLSGVGGYSLAFDGGKEFAFFANTAPNPAYEPYATVINANASGQYDPQLAGITIESLPAGSHNVGVTTVDRATNRSAPAVVNTKVDYDTPEGWFVWTNSAVTPWHLGRNATVSVNTSDAAGISAVSFYVDDAYVGGGTNVGNGVWSLTRDFSGFADGGHVIKAVVQDMIGLDVPTSGAWVKPHTATAYQWMTLDKAAPKAKVSASSYRRSITVKAKNLTEAATMKVTIDGAAYASRSVKRSKTYTQKRTVARRSAGSRTRRVKWSVNLMDDYGNSTTYSGRSTATYYKIKRISPSKVRIIVY